jgi:hypothetical protein
VAVSLVALALTACGSTVDMRSAGTVSADTFRTDVTHRTDGVAGYRSLAYRDTCSCLQYVSPLQIIS